MSESARERLQQQLRNAKIPGGGRVPPGFTPGPMGPLGRLAMTVLIGGGVLGGAAYYSLYTVPGGHRAIVFNRFTGLKDMEYKQDGTHFRIPWVEWPIIYDIRTKPRVIASLTGSKDLQMVNLSVRVLSKPDPKNLPFIYRRLGYEYDEKVLPSIVNEVCKQVVAQFNASQLLTQREQVSKMINDNLKARAQEFRIVLEDVSITDLKFGVEFMTAVEQKQVAQQDAERARFLVDKALQEKQSIIIKAIGEAKSAELIGKAIQKNPGFVELRRIDAARAIADTISSSNNRNRTLLDSSALMLNVAAEIETGKLGSSK